MTTSLTTSKDLRQKSSHLALHIDQEEDFRKEAEKWDTIWAKHNKKTDEIFNKILQRLETEDNDQNSRN